MDNSVWQSILGEIELKVDPRIYKSWFEESEIVDYQNDTLTISVINLFAKTQFEKKYTELITSLLHKHGIEPRRIDYTIKKTGTHRTINRETSYIPTNTSVATASPLAASKPTHQNSLNPRYTFESFIVGGSNDLAYSAAKAIAQAPGEKYNPFFIYGGVGLGKTHIAQAIGNEILKNNASARILYVSSDTFVSEFLDHVRFKKKGFSDKYRNIDVLIVDDIQFIAGKEKTQEEFFHTFNALHGKNKQIIITSDRPPRNIPTLTDRLSSRFEMGMTVDVQMPDFETRQAIISTKASISGVELGRDVVEYLATNIKTNIRELEGALNQLLAFADLRQITPDLQTAQALLTGNTRQSRPRHITAKQIIDKTAKFFSISPAEICSAKRDKHIVVPRQIAMYLLRSELHMSYPNLAKELGRKDHTTAMHSVDKIEKAIKLDLIVREQIESIRETLYA